MDRREILRLAVAALPLGIAGCTSTGGPDGGAAESPTPSPTPTATATPSPSPSPSPSPTPAGTPVEVVSLADQPDVPVEYGVEMVERLATDDHPARLRVTIRNPTDSQVVLGEERAVQFHHVTSEDGALYLLPSGSRAAEFADPGCWRLTDGVAVPEYYGTIEIQAGESVNAESHVLGSTDLPEGECLPSGEHRVVASGKVAESADAVLEGEAATEFEWGFTLRIG